MSDHKVVANNLLSSTRSITDRHDNVCLNPAIEKWKFPKFKKVESDINAEKCKIIED